MASTATLPTPSKAAIAAGGLTRTFTETITVPVVNRAGETVGEVTIDPANFGGKISQQLLHEAVLMYQANQRAGTHSTLRRGEVAGSTKKLFRQKGTGNARAGTKRTNKRRGGGTAKGPKPRDYEYHMPKKAVQAATRMAILSKFTDGEAVILDDLAIAAPKTKDMVAVLGKVKVGTKRVKSGEGGETVEKTLTLADTTCLIGTAAYDANVYKSSRNIQGVKVLPASEFNAYTVLKQRRLVLTRAALDVLTELGKAKAAKKSATADGATAGA